MGRGRRGSLKHFKEAAAVYDPQQHDTQISLYGEDLGVAAHCFGALALWALGYPEQAAVRAFVVRPRQGLYLALLTDD